jgi:integrase
MAERVKLEPEKTKRIKVKAKANRVTFTNLYLDRLLKQKPDEQVTIWDSRSDGLCILHNPGKSHRKESSITWRCCFYLKSEPGKPKYVKIGSYGEKEVPYVNGDGILKKLNCADIEAVRNRCYEIRRDAKELGIDPRKTSVSADGEISANAKRLVRNVIKEYLKLGDVATNKSKDQTERIFDRYVLPEWGDRDIEQIERSDIRELLYKIAQGQVEHTTTSKAGVVKVRTIGTPNVAAATFAQISALFAWYTPGASNNFRSPIIKGMTNKGWAAKSRNRFLSDDEIRALWQATAELGVYGSLIRTALLTAQRFYKVVEMRRGQIKDGVWDAVEDNDPDNKQVSIVPLSSLALEVINSVPIIDAGRHSKDFVFSLNGKTPYVGFINAREMLDKRMAEILGTELKHWQQRDLRRTAKTLMGHAGVSSEISERCLAHKMGGVEGVYNKYHYLHEKRDAFQRLTALIEHILDGGDREDWRAKDKGNEKAA